MNRFLRFWISLVTIFITFTPAHSQQAAFIERDTAHSKFPTAWATDISPLCYNDSQFYLQSYLNRDKWAFKMFKTTGFLSLESLLNSRMEVFTSSPGLFDECLSIEAPSFQGQYCSAFFKTEEGMGREKQQNSDGHTFKLPRVGFCIPSSCSSSDFRSSVSQMIDRKSLAVSNVNSSIVTINDENYCYTRNKIEQAAQFDGPDIAVIVVLSLLSVLVLLGTLYDGWRSFKNDELIDSFWNKFLLCFSVLENGRKVLSTETSSSEMSCLHGIRVLSATWIILFHTHRYIANAPVENKYGPNRHLLHDWDIQALTRGSISVDTFFMMSGMLVCYSLLREIKLNNGRFNLFTFYFRRYIRISPFYFLYVGFLATMLVYLGTGPLWHFIHLKSESCRLNWWKHFLYIDNFLVKFNPPVECMIQSWYLAADMQLFILSPLFVYPLWKWRRAGLAWIIFVVVVLIGSIGTIYTVWVLPATMMVMERPIEFKNSNSQDYYFRTFGRAPQYLVGTLLGWILNNGGINHQRQINVLRRIIGWILSIGTIVICVYGMVPFLNEELVPEMNPLIRVAFGTLSRFGWASAVGWIVFACLSGCGGFVNTILSWKGFVPLSRLSYVAYLVHLDLILVYYIGLNRTAFYYTKMNVFMIYLAVVVVSFMVAFIFSIAFEMPFINIERHLINTRKPIPFLAAVNENGNKENSVIETILMKTSHRSTS